MYAFGYQLMKMEMPLGLALKVGLQSFLITLLWVFLSSSSAIFAAESTKKKPAEVEWQKPRFSERQSDRNTLIYEQLQNSSIPIKNKQVLMAMRAVPRHLFVPKYLQGAAYADRPLPIGSGQTISQPFIVAYMTEKLEISAAAKVLEIGTGSGYQAAVLSELTPHVYSIEIIKELGQKNGKRLTELGYSAIQVKIGDGYLGWAEHAPFDAILVTCAAGHIPPPLLQQLKPGGRMIIPVGGTYDVQMLILVKKDLTGEIQTHQLIPVRFVPMTGKSQGE